MASLNFSITATTEEFDGFADRLGYMTTLYNTEGVPTPNPETRTNFLLRVMKEELAGKFYAPYVSDIEREVRDQRETDKEAMRNNIRARITIALV